MYFIDVVTSTSNSANEHIDWNFDDDHQLVNWATNAPHDWQYGGKDVFVFGNGRNGQLGEPEVIGRQINIPRLSSSFAGAQHVICGQNCTFIIHATGTVQSVGEGSYGRLGHGNSDDMQNPSVIAALQGYLKF